MNPMVTGTSQNIKLPSLLRHMLWLLLVASSVLGQPGLGKSSRVVSKIQVEVVTYTPDGFSPNRIVRPPGDFHLVMRGLDGPVADLIEIVDERGEAKKNLDVAKTRSRWVNSLLSLNPGVYSLRIAEKPSVKMTIVIDPDKK